MCLGVEAMSSAEGRESIGALPEVASKGAGSSRLGGPWHRAVGPASGHSPRACESR